MQPMEHIWTMLMLKICKNTLYAYVSRIWKLTRFTRLIRKVFVTKILLSGKFSPFLTLGIGWLQELLAELKMLWEGVKKVFYFRNDSKIGDFPHPQLPSVHLGIFYHFLPKKSLKKTFFLLLPLLLQSDDCNVIVIFVVLWVEKQVLNISLLEIAYFLPCFPPRSCCTQDRGSRPMKRNFTWVLASGHFKWPSISHLAFLCAPRVTWRQRQKSTSKAW